MQHEIRGHLNRTPQLQGFSGIVQIAPIMAEVTLFTASRCLQGLEVREKLNSSFARLYHALDDGFQPINFMLPWMPLPQNRKRDAANRTMTQIYSDIIRARREKKVAKDSEDMIWNLMECKYKDGTPMPDTEIAHLMIGLLMAGQHSSSVTSSWIMLHLADQPEMMEELYQEQLQALGDFTKPLAYDHLEKLPLIRHVISETLRIHPPIHSIMRKVKNPLPVEGTDWVVPPSHVVLASPGTISLDPVHFPDPYKWDPHRWESIAEPEEMENDKVDYGYGLVSTGASSLYLPFGAGRHRCIGENYAYLQLTVVVAMMVRTFKLSRVDERTAVVATDYSVSAIISLHSHLVLISKSLFSRPMEPAMIRWERRTR